MLSVKKAGGPCVKIPSGVFPGMDAANATRFFSSQFPAEALPSTELWLPGSEAQLSPTFKRWGKEMIGSL